MTENVENVVEQDVITEGLAFVKGNIDSVFYNPVQVFNRDLSIVMIKTFQEVKSQEIEMNQYKSKKKINETDPRGIDILEAMSATGLRSIRYMKEIDGIRSILVNDYDENAVLTIEDNIRSNGLDVNVVIPTHSDCRLLMMQKGSENDLFDVVDVDPYGSAAPFLDSAVQCVDDGGLLIVTCTDMAVLCGTRPETCWSKYQSISVRSKCCHESALRILLGAIQSSAARYSIAIEPVASVSVDFYIRVFVRVHKSQFMTKSAFAKMGHLFQCNNCDTMYSRANGTVIKVGNNTKYQTSNDFPIGEHCKFCKGTMKMIGPLWTDRIHDPVWIEKSLEILEKQPLLATHDRILGLLSLCKEEMNIPYYYDLSNLCSRLRLETINNTNFRSALLNAGYSWSSTHCNPKGFKTNAPMEFVWDILRYWNLNAPNGPKNLSKYNEKSVPFQILSVEPTHEIDFTYHADSENKVTVPKWFKSDGGPKSKAKRKRNDDEEIVELKKKRVD